jgi:hypothetical protein
VDCSLLVRLCDMYVDCCPVIDFERFMIREFGEVEFESSRIQLSNYVVTRVMRQLDGAQTSPSTVFKEEAFKGCYRCLVFSLCVLHSVYVFDFSLLSFNNICLMGGY